MVIYNPTDLYLWEGTIVRASKCCSSVFLCVGFLVCARLPRNLGLILRCFLVQMKVAFGGVNSVSHPPRQPGRSNEQTGTSNALAFPGIRYCVHITCFAYVDER